MADGVFGVEVVTPEQSLVAGGATSVVLATSEGALTVLDGHTPLIGDVVPCELKVEPPDGPLLRLAVHGGFIQVDTSPGAADGLAEEIDVPRAETARDAATQRVNELRSGRGPAPAATAAPEGDAADQGDVALAESEGALARAELRLAVAAGGS